MKRWTNLLVIALVSTPGVAAAGSQGASDSPLTYLGQVRPRAASEIRASNWSVGAETMDRNYTIYANWKSYLGPLGFKKARLQAGWAKTERERGVYNWAWLDAIVHDMAAQGVEPWMCLCYGNAIYADGGGTRLGAQIPKTAEALAAWERFVGAIVTRYQDVIDEWEVWNEPNLRGSNSAPTYVEFLVRTAETVRAVQPKARILAMSTAGVDWRFVDAVLGALESKGKLHLVDEVTYHPYKRNPDESYEAVARLRQVVGDYSDRIILRQGENGAPSEWRRTKALSEYDWTELSQSKWALRRLLGDLGRDIPSSYFSIMDMKYPDEMNRKGLLHSREDQMVDHAKAAYYACQNLAAIFDHTLERIQRYGYQCNCRQSLSVFAYESRYSRRQVVTIWLDGATPSDSNEKTPVNFRFAAGDFDKPVYVDLREGKVYAIGEPHWDRDGTVYEFRRVPCYDSPILIADKSVIPMATRTR
jgi:hypothetical protein